MFENIKSYWFPWYLHKMASVSLQCSLESVRNLSANCTHSFSSRLAHVAFNFGLRLSKFLWVFSPTLLANILNIEKSIGYKSSEDRGQKHLSSWSSHEMTSPASLSLQCVLDLFLALYQMNRYPWTFWLGTRWYLCLFLQFLSHLSASQI